MTGQPYRDHDFYDAYVDRLAELDDEDRPAYIREVRALGRPSGSRPSSSPEVGRVLNDQEAA